MAKKTGLTVAELIRRAIDLFLKGAGLLTLCAALTLPAHGDEFSLTAQCRRFSGLGFAESMCGPLVEARYRFLHGEASHEKTSKNSFTGTPDETWVTNAAVGVDRTFGPLRLGVGYQWYRQHLDSVNETARSPYVMLGHDAARWDATLRYTIGTQMLDYLRAVGRWHAFRRVSLRGEVGHLDFNCCGRSGRTAWSVGFGVGYTLRGEPVGGRGR